jgi:hypothetical protein
MKIQMKTVINWDFLNCNCFILTNRHNSEIINFRYNLNFSLVSLRNTPFHIVFPKHNLDFPMVSLRNTWFHVIFPKHNVDFSPVSLRNTQFHVVSMGKLKHKMVQWVWNSLKLITKAKDDIFQNFLEIYNIWFFSTSISNFQKLMRYFLIRDCTFYQSRSCLTQFSWKKLLLFWFLSHPVIIL